MQTALERYKNAKARGRQAKTPATNYLLVCWDHMMNDHGAAPGEWGNNTLGWHERNFSDCTTLPSYDEGKKVEFQKRPLKVGETSDGGLLLLEKLLDTRVDS